MSNKKEIKWADVVGFEGLYKVSNIGEIRSLDRTIEYSGKFVRRLIGRDLSVLNCTNGYKFITLWKGNKPYVRLIHRLVAESFIENDKNVKYVNHKNGVRDDNHVENLEWCTPSENLKHSYSQLGRKAAKGMLGKCGKLHIQSKPVVCQTFGIYYESAKMAARATGISQGSISDICNGKRIHKDGVVFSYANY